MEHRNQSKGRKREPSLTREGIADDIIYIRIAVWVSPAEITRSQCLMFSQLYQ